MEQQILSTQPIITPVTVPPAPPKKSFPKWPLVLLLGIFLGGGAVFAWQKYLPKKTVFVGPSPLTLPQPSAEADPTAGWKKYINEKYELQYPQTYQMVNLTAGGGINIPVNARNIYISDPARSDYEDRLVSIEYIDLLVSPGAKWTEDRVKIDNKETIKFTSGDNSSNFDIYHIYLTDKGGLEVYARKNNPLIDLILSTLKFTDQTRDDYQQAQDCLNQTNGGGGRIGIANPASSFCGCMGGELAIEETQTGQIGICHINGEAVEEWEFYRRYLDQSED